jgi:hypothetical protein
MKEQALSPAERCPVLSVDPKPLGVLDIRDTLEVLFRAGKMSGGAAIQLRRPPTHGRIFCCSASGEIMIARVPSPRYRAAC